MANPKILIAGGCSFTEYPRIVTRNGIDTPYNNWPYHLNKTLGTSAYYQGVSAAGNDFIANKTISALQYSIDTHKMNPQDILVGVMWSGLSRKAFYLSQNNTQVNTRHNPHAIASQPNYYFVYHSWDDDLSKNYYKYFHDDIGSIIDNIKNMLLVQNVCKLHKVKYFFTEYSDDTVTNSNLKTHPDVKYFYDLLDKDQFLPVKNMRDWCANDSGLEYLIPKDDHPTNEMSEAFTNRVIMPWLKNKRYIV